MASGVQRSIKWIIIVSLTNINEASRLTFAKLFTFIRQCDLNDTGNMAWRCLNTNRMRCYQFTPYQHRAEYNLQSIEEIITYDYDMGTANRPSFTRWYRFYAWRCHWHRWIETCAERNAEGTNGNKQKKGNNRKQVSQCGTEDGNRSAIKTTTTTTSRGKKKLRNKDGSEIRLKLFDTIGKDN